MTTPAGESRRSFLKKSASAVSVIAAADIGFSSAVSSWAVKRIGAGMQKAAPDKSLPWYRRTLRWGQTNITEADIARYDIGWWRQHWKRTHTQGVLINSGGIVAYYPSRFPLHYRAAGLGNRDLFGELAAAAHEEGLAVIARMDSNRTHEDFYRAHPDWFAIDAEGKPYRDTELYVTCVNSPYYDEYIPDVLREIVERSHPEGFADNNWNGVDRDHICYCENCQRKFRDQSGHPIPTVKNWDDAVYRQWIQWNYARRTEIWDINNRATRAAGGADCLWLGMQSGTLPYQGLRFRDNKSICERSEIVMLDDQARRDPWGFQHNAQIGQLFHGLVGWDKLVPEATALYQAIYNSPTPQFRLTTKPELEVRLHALEGFAGGTQPWWHHVGAYQEDRRSFRIAEPLLRWHEENQEFLVNRRPIASVGLVWTQRNTDFHGRDNSDDLTELPWRGWTNALVRARIPCIPVHADHITRDANQLSVLILPNLAAMSSAQVDAVRSFVERGGGLIATDQSSRCNEWGEPLSDFALADLFKAHVMDGPDASTDAIRRRRAIESQQTYLRLTPDVASRVYGPHIPSERPITRERHAVLKGFDETDILQFGGVLDPLRIDSGTEVLMTFVPSFPTSPPEAAWMREPRTDIPGLILNEVAGRGRVAFMPADLDRRYGRDNQPDHANLLANLVRWCARDNVPLRVEGTGFVDCHLYQQADHLVLHVVNLTNVGAWRGAVDELIPIGPLKVSVRLPENVRARHGRFLVSKDGVKVGVKKGWAEFTIPKILDHEVAVIG
jgi:hypothetical protein